MASDGHQMLLAILRANPLMSVDVVETRERMELGAQVTPPPDEVRCEERDADGVPVELISMPSSRDGLWLLYFHAGAYTSGSLNTHRLFCTRLAESLRVHVCDVDYRLAPEHPFPAAVEDAVAAWRWLTGDDGLGVDPSRCMIAGDSAGGGLAIATMLALIDAGDRLPAASFVICPWADLTNTNASLDSRAADDPILSREILESHAARYLDGADPRHRLASPGLADLTGLPPLLIHAGDADVLVDDARQLAAGAQRAGVDVTLDVGAEMLHCYVLFGGLLPEADEAMARTVAWVAERFPASS